MVRNKISLNSSSYNSNNSNSSSWKALIIIGVLFFLFTYSLYMIVGHIFLSSLNSSSSSLSSPSDTLSKIKNKIHENDENEMTLPVDSEGNIIEETHFFLETNKNKVLLCDQRDTLHELSDMIEEEEDYNFHILSNFDEPKYYQLCIGMHEHRHTLNINLIDGTCDLYFATTHIATPTSWDWKINHRLSKKISIHTYSQEFLTLNDGSFFITVVNHQVDQNSKHDCHINIKISSFSNERLLRQLPSLRGGKVLLKRDLVNLTHNSKIFH